MAVTFTEEALRAVQDALSIYEAILSEYAPVNTPACFGLACILSYRK
jgi:hypothetical protein